MAGLVEGKSGFVTGSAGGIGRATALALAREGAAVVVNDLEERRADGDETVRLIEEAGGQARFVADITRAADCEVLVAATVEAFGRIDFAHNNAGIERHATISDRSSFVTDVALTVDAGSTAGVTGR